MAKKNNHIFTVLGSSNHSDEERQAEDFYATDPAVVKLLLKLEQFQTNILEPMCGQGHIAETLRKHGHKVKAFDLIDRGYGNVQNFLSFKTKRNDFDIISNPPYKNVDNYVYQCMKLMTRKGQKTALLIRLLYLEGKARRVMFDRFPPIRVWVSSSRVICAKNGDFVKYSSGSAVAYAWFIWEYGYKGKTTLGWFN